MIPREKFLSHSAPYLWYTTTSAPHYITTITSSSTTPSSLQHHLHHQSATTCTTIKSPASPTLQSVPPTSNQLVTTRTTMDLGVGATVAQPEGTVPNSNALSLRQHFATYVEFKAAMCRWAVTVHFETRYEKSEKTVNIVT